MKLEIEIYGNGRWWTRRQWFWRYAGAVAAYEAARRSAAELGVCRVALYDHQGRVVRRSRWGEEF